MVFSHNRRDKVPKATTRERRGLKVSPLLDIFEEPYFKGNALGSTTYEIEKLINSQNEGDRGKKPKKAPRPDNARKLSPLGFLKTFQDTLARLLPYLHFNYLQLLIHGQELQCDLRDRLHADFQALIGDSYNEEMKRKIPSWCAHVIAITADYGPATGFTQMQWIEGRATVIEESRKALEKVIEKAGGVVSKGLVDALKGENSGKQTEAGLLFLEKYGRILSTDETTRASEDGSEGGNSAG